MSLTLSEDDKCMTLSDYEELMAEAQEREELRRMGISFNGLSILPCEKLSDLDMFKKAAGGMLREEEQNKNLPPGLVKGLERKITGLETREDAISLLAESDGISLNHSDEISCLRNEVQQLQSMIRGLTTTMDRIAQSIESSRGTEMEAARKILKNVIVLSTYSHRKMMIPESMQALLLAKASFAEIVGCVADGPLTDASMETAYTNFLDLARKCKLRK